MLPRFETPLDLLLEGLTINQVLDECVAYKLEASAWLTEEIEVPENLIEKFLLDHGISTRRRLISWPSQDMEKAAQEVRAAYARLTEIEEEFEHVRRILFAWDTATEYQSYLPKTKAEYLSELRNLEGAINRQAEDVKRSFEEFEAVKSRVLDPATLLENLEPADLDE